MNLMLRHTLATLQYRTRTALVDAPADFGTFSAGGGVRTPIELLRHMTQLAAFSLSHLRGEPRATLDLPGAIDTEFARFERALGDLSRDLASRGLDDELACRLLQGPFADGLGHAGQLAMLRRLAGSPVPAEHFFAATVNPSNLEA